MLAAEAPQGGPGMKTLGRRPNEGAYENLAPKMFGFSLYLGGMKNFSIEAAKGCKQYQ